MNPLFYCSQSVQYYRMESQEQVNFKMIVLGDQGVGKSSLITRYIKNSFSEQYNVTVGVEFASKMVSMEGGTRVRLQIWDTAGQELFRAVVRSFYRGICAVYLLYAVDNAKTFQELKGWLREVQQHAHEEVVLFLIGARADLTNNREVSREEAAVFLKEINGAFFIETSSKTGENVEALFRRAAQILYKKYISNGSFRNLVRPVLASGATTSVQSSQVLRRNTQQQLKLKKKSCCS